MAGGTFTSMNKVRPGVYIRFRTGRQSGLSIGTRGTVAICEPMSWGPVGAVMTVEAGGDPTPYTGYGISAPQCRFLNEIFKGTNRTGGAAKVLLYRPSANGSAAATATIGNLTVTANYPGVRGNDISVAITESVDTPDYFDVATIVDGAVVDAQSVMAVGALTGNAWVAFSGDGALTATTGTALTGGADGEVQAAAYSAFLDVIEAYKFDVLIYDGDAPTIATAYAAFIERLASENGQYAQLVAAGLNAPDSRFVVNVQNAVTLTDGTELTPQQVTWWVGGALAGANYNESLTYAVYPGAAAVSPAQTNSQIISAINSGIFVLSGDSGAVRVETDINSLTTFTADIGRVYRYNKTIRLCNTIANDIAAQFSEGYIGVVDNNESGRMRFKAALVGYFQTIEANNGIQNFTPEDVTVEAGEDINSIVVTVALQVVGTAEKIYLTVEIS